jgi:hypothetical protein
MTSGESRERGIGWGMEVAQTVLSWRATDGFSPPPSSPFIGGLAVGQWRPTGGSCVAMTALGLAFTAPFVVATTDAVRSWTSTESVELDVRRRLQQRGKRSVKHRFAGDQSNRPGLRRSGRATPACTGIRRRTRLHAPTACRNSESNRLLALLNSQWPTPRSRSGVRAGTMDWVVERGHLATGYGRSTGDDDNNPDPPPPRTGCRSSIRLATPSIPPAIRVRTGVAARPFSSPLRRYQTFTVTTTGCRIAHIPASRRLGGTETTRASGAGCTTRARSPSATRSGEAIANYVNLNAMLRIHGRDER